MYYDSLSSVEFNAPVDSSTGLTVVVASYGGVGENITGSFSGAVLDYNNETTMSLTDGYFKVLRLKDDAFAQKTAK